MKKFLAIVAIASFAVACNNSSESKDATVYSAAIKDSLAKVQAAADSAAKAAADTAAKADTADKADTAAKK